MTISANFPNVQPSLLLDFANAKQLPPQVTFTRATTAAYYDGSTTALAEQNLLTYSQTFDGWNYGGMNFTTGQTAPDGTSTAVKIAANATLTQHYLGILGTLPSVTAFSVYAKAAGVTTVRLDGNTSLQSALFDLSAGTVSSTSGTGTVATITSVGSGWYRCTMYTPTARNSFNMWPGGNQGSYSGNGTDGIIVWGAQAEYRTATTDYTATTSQAITNYIPVLLTAGGGQPRFDHNPTTSESLGLLIEQQSTNIQVYSENFSSWTIQTGGCTVQTNVNVAPNGTLTADKLVQAPASAGNQYTRLYYSNNFTSGQAYTQSVYAKAAGSTRFSMIGSGSGWVGNTFSVIFDLSAGTIISQSSTNAASITPVGNGWYRCTVTATPVTTNSGTIPIDVLNSSNDSLFTGNGFDGIYLWGAQLEASGFPTSYISTTSASATRAPEVVTMTGNNFSSWFNAGEGTVYYELETAIVGANTFSFNFDIGNSSSSQDVLFSSAGAGSALYVTSGNSNVVNINAGVTPVAGTFFKTALFYEVNNFAVSRNGAAAVTDVVGTLPYSLARLVLGTAYDLAASNYINGHMRKFAYYPQAVTTAQLAVLTS